MQAAMADFTHRAPAARRYRCAAAVVHTLPQTRPCRCAQAPAHGTLSGGHGDAEARRFQLAEGWALRLAVLRGCRWRPESAQLFPWPGGPAWCFTACGGTAPVSASRARRRWRSRRH